MWPQNELTRRLNLRYPIFQAPMGEHSTPALAATVSNAGGLGGLGMWGFSAEDAGRRIAGFRQQSGGSLNVNYPLWPDAGDLKGKSTEMRALIDGLLREHGLDTVPEPQASAGAVTPEHLEMLCQARPEVVSFHFGLPDRAVIDALHAAGVFILSSATTVDEARKLEAAGVDAVIAQGAEAGGHRGTFTGVAISRQPGLFALLPQIVDAVSLPVIAAGGVSDGRTIAAALMLGASAVQIGTAFLRCEEASVSDIYRDVLAGSGDADTIVTRTISGRPARAVANRLVEALEASGAEPLPFPAQYAMTNPFENLDMPEMAPVLTGQSAALTREMPAADLMATLVSETEGLLTRATGPG